MSSPVALFQISIARQVGADLMASVAVCGLLLLCLGAGGGPPGAEPVTELGEAAGLADPGAGAGEFGAGGGGDGEF